jgi:hypothetical protein
LPSTRNAFAVSYSRLIDASGVSKLPRSRSAAPSVVSMRAEMGPGFTSTGTSVMVRLMRAWAGGGVARPLYSSWMARARVTHSSLKNCATIGLLEQH